MAINAVIKPNAQKSKRRWLPKSFSVDKADMPVFKRLAREAAKSKPRVSESALLVQILKDHFFVKDAVASSNGGGS